MEKRCRQIIATFEKDSPGGYLKCQGFLLCYSQKRSSKESNLCYFGNFPDGSICFNQSASEANVVCLELVVSSKFFLVIIFAVC